MVADAETVGRRIADARGRARLTQAEVAAASNLERSALAKIESGTRRVSALELARLAQALHARIEWFVDDVPQALISRRSTQEPGTPSPRIDALIERLARNVEFLATHDAGMRLAEIQHPKCPESITDTEALAEAARDLMGIGQVEPLINLAEQVVGLGLLAFCVDLGPDTADAATILLRHGAVAAVNGALRTGRRRLALAHELAHYLVADQFSVDWRVAEYQDTDRRENLFDRFARAVLLPQQGIRRSWPAMNSRDGLRMSAVRLASQYRVDMATLARRLVELELISADQFNSVRTVRTTQADIVDLNLVVADELNAPNLPRPYVQAVMRLYRKEVVSADRALDLLLGTWTESDLPELPQRSEDEIWQYM